MSNLLKSKFLFGLMIVAVMLVAGALVAEAAYSHTVTLRQGSSGSQVMALQQALGVSADGAFGPMTKAAVMAFQSSHSLTADGVVGPATGAALSGESVSGGSYLPGCSSTSGYSTTTGMSCASGSSLPAGCSSTSGYSSSTGAKCDGSSSSSSSSTSGDLEGGAGSITVTKTSDYSAEEVGEGEEEMGVLSFELEAEDSDVDVTAVKVELHQGTAADSEDLTDYLSTVSVFMGGEMVGEADVEDFSENNDVYTKTISLDGAVVGEGDMEDFSVRVNAQNSLDSSDIDSAVVNVGVSSVRFMDGDGVSSTDSFTLDIDDDATDDTLEDSFTFGTFASASNTELKVSVGADDDSVNQAHVIDIHATDETQDVELLSFNLEVEGDSDVNVDSLPVYLGTTNTNVDDVVSGISLWMDGEEIATVAMSTDCIEDGTGCADVGTEETYFFDDLDLDLTAGNDYEFVVAVDIYGDTDTPGNVAPGNTLFARFSETETDLSQFDVVDEAGDELADGDKTGAVVGESSEVRDVGITVALVGTPTAVKSAGDASATQSDSGLFTITFDVTAFGADMYVDSTAPDATGGSTESNLTIVPGVANQSGDLTCTISSPSGATEATSFLVQEDETERFAITCNVIDGTVDLYDAFFSVALQNLAYAVTDAQTANLDYTFNLEDFKTPQIFLNDNGA